MVFSKFKTAYSIETGIKRSQNISFLEILSEDVVWQFEQDRPAKLTDLFGRVLTINGIRTVAHNAKATSRA